MRIVKIWFENNRIYGLTDDGGTLWQSLLYYPRLLQATDAERNDYEINAFGIRWEKIDEDVSFESFEYDDPEPSGLSKILLSHPELNLQVVARNIGVEPNLLVAYANGTQKPSQESERLILQGIREMGKNLLAV